MAKNKENSGEWRQSSRGNGVLPMIIIRVPENYILVISERQSSLRQDREANGEAASETETAIGQRGAVFRPFRGWNVMKNRNDDETMGNEVNVRLFFFSRYSAGKE